MPQAMITIQAKQSPAIGKKQGKVQDTDGRLWNVWGDKLQNYREGVTYDIVYEESEFNDHKFNLIKTANPSNGTAAQGGYVPQAGPKPQSPHSDGWPGPAPRASAAASPQLIDKDCMIFVCGVINNSMANPNVNPFEIGAVELVAMVNKARQVWRNTLGKSQSAGDLNDEVLFT